MAGLNITTFGASYVPSREYGNFGKYNPIYRRGTFITRALSGDGTGVAFGRNLVTHILRKNRKYYDVKGNLINNNEFNQFLRAHETGHIDQQNRMGYANFYGRTFKEYFIHPGAIWTYSSLGTLEYGAQMYALNLLGYYYDLYHQRLTRP